MPTRLKRPSFWRQLLVAGCLVGFQAYLGYSAIGGQFGVESQKRMQQDIELLKARSASLSVEIDAYRQKVALFRSNQLDPDILTEKARSLLSMARTDDIVIMVDPRDGKPISGSFRPLTDDELTQRIGAETD
jgi:cell division protein FtsB